MNRGRWDLMPAAPIENLAAELLANRNLLAALAGPAIALTVDAEGGARPVRLTGEDLTRVLVNLVKNAAEAMPAGGRIQIGCGSVRAEAGTAETLALTIEDNGPGIAERPGSDLRVRLTTAGEGRKPRRLAGLASRAGTVDYPLDCGGGGGRIFATNRAGPEPASRSNCRYGKTAISY